MIFIIGGRNQGQRGFAESLAENENIQVIGDYHLKVREQLKKGKDVIECAKELFASSPDVIVYTDEIGCGVVPVDTFEREYRNAAGKANIWLAEHSDEVYRVICGIGQRIK